MSTRIAKVKHLAGFLQRLRTHKRAASLPMMAMAVVPVVGAIGGAVDLSRIYAAQVQLQAGVDAAALAGARAYHNTSSTSEGRENQVNAYFDANFASGYMGTTGLNKTPVGAPQRYQIVDGQSVTTISASVNVPMLFLKLFGIADKTVAARAVAKANRQPLEIMMVLDNTGSMRFQAGDVTRITALKSAAKDFLSIVYQGSTDRPEVAIGMVPYDITVNVRNVLTEAGGSIDHIPGFSSNFSYTKADGTNVTWTAPTWTYGVTTAAANGNLTETYSANSLGWKGCVMNEPTIKSLSATNKTGAWDIARTIPGEGSHPAVKPYLQPIFYVPNSTSASKADPTSNYYSYSTIEANNNLFKLDNAGFNTNTGEALANSPAYKHWFYQYYIGLNNGSGNMADDVIVKTDAAGSYYNPATDGATNPRTDFRVRYSKVPKQGNWNSAKSASINPNGGQVDDLAKYATPWPSPNWQCPEAAEKVQYGKPRSYWENYIDTKNSAIYNGNGTIHHAGLLWGWRLLMRNDKWSRTPPPGNNIPPRRALVFMTDGESNLSTSGGADRTFTWYGNAGDLPISNDIDSYKSKSELRFQLICEQIKAEASPPDIYIIGLGSFGTEAQNLFEGCAPNQVYLATNATQLTKAFQDIAGKLIDLHLANE